MCRDEQLLSLVRGEKALHDLSVLQRRTQILEHHKIRCFNNANRRVCEGRASKSANHLSLVAAGKAIVSPSKLRLIRPRLQQVRLNSLDHPTPPTPHQAWTLEHSPRVLSYAYTCVDCLPAPILSEIDAWTCGFEGHSCRRNHRPAGMPWC